MVSQNRAGRVGAAFLAAGFMATVFFGCTDMKYIVHADQTLQTSKIPASTIAVFPIDKLNYQPPSGCMSPGMNLGDQTTYQAHWNDKIRSSLSARFPNQKWIFLSASQSLLQPGAVDFYTVVEESKRYARSEQINTLKSDSIVFEPLPSSQALQANLQKLRDSTGAQYALVFVQPLLSGNTQYTAPTMVSSGGMMMGGGGSSQTYYTADVQALVWDCSSGKLLFSSGGWCNTTSPCFFIPPEDMAIEGVNSKFQDNLLKIITALLNYNASRYLAQASR